MSHAIRFVSKSKKRLTLAGMLVALTVAAVAIAYFSGQGSDTAGATVGSLPAPSITSATPGAGRVALNWSTVSPPSGADDVKYYVTRDGGPAGGNCPTQAAPTTAVSCLDTGLALGTYHYKVTAVWRSWTATSSQQDATVTVEATIDHFNVSAPASSTAGGAFNVTVTAKDDTDTTLTGYAGTIHFASSDGNATLPSDYPFVTGDHGSHTFTNVTLKTSGSQTVNVNDTADNTKNGSDTVNVTHAAASAITLSGSTSDLASGSNRTFTATIKDDYGNTVDTGPDSSASVTFAQTAGAGSVSGLGAATASNGVATKMVTGNVAGSVTLKASATINSTPTDSNTLSFNVTPGTASQIALSGSTADLQAGSTRTFTATIKDAAGNTVTSGADSSASVTFAQTAGAGSVSGLGSATASGGVATKIVTGMTAGSVTLKASATINSTPTDSNTLSFDVIVGPATQISLSGSTSDLASGSDRTLTATIKDAGGNTVTTGPDSGASVTFSKTAGTGTVSGLGSATASNGVATKLVTGNLAGPITLKASASLGGTPTDSNTLSFTVTFGTASQIALSGSTADLASGTGRTFTATIQDAAGNTVTGGDDSSRSVTFAQTTGSGSVSGLGSATASNGVATKTVTGNIAGPVTLQASATINSNPTDSNTLSFNVTFGDASQIALSGSTADLQGGTTRNFTATIKDAAGNTVASGADSSASVTFAKTTGAGSVTGLGAVAASGGVATKTVTGGLAGSVTLKASATINSTATDSNTLTFTVTVGPASQISLTGATTDLTAGSRTFTATIQDGGGNTITTGADSTASVTFAQTAGAGAVNGLGTTTASAGVATVTVTGRTPGSVTLRASATINSTATNSNTLTFTVAGPTFTTTFPLNGATYSGATWHAAGACANDSTCGTATASSGSIASVKVQLKDLTDGVCYHNNNTGGVNNAAFDQACSASTFYTASGTTTWTIILANDSHLVDGHQYEETVQVTDGAGTTSQVINFTFDDSAPTISNVLLVNDATNGVGAVPTSGTFKVYATVADTSAVTVTADLHNVTGVAGDTAVPMSLCTSSCSIRGQSYNYVSAGKAASGTAANNKNITVTATDAATAPNSTTTGSLPQDIIATGAKTPTSITLKKVGGTTGKAEANDQIVVVFPNNIYVPSLCLNSTTLDNVASNTSLSSTATVTMTNTATNQAEITASAASSCGTLRFGTIAVPGSTMVDSGTNGSVLTFANSDISWNGSNSTFTITLGTASGTATTDPSNRIATYAPPTSSPFLTDAAGNNISNSVASGNVRTF